MVDDEEELQSMVGSDRNMDCDRCEGTVRKGGVTT